MNDKSVLARFAAVFPEDVRPQPFERDPAVLRNFYASLLNETPRLPALFEKFLLTHQWIRGNFGGADVRVGKDPCQGFGLLENDDDTTLATFGAAVRRDRALWKTLIAEGYFPFGQGGCAAYDPICFALREWQSDDCPIVGIAHEPILCYNRVRVAVKLASSFRELVQKVTTQHTKDKPIVI